MDCQQCQSLLDAHLDRELDLRTDAEVETHVTQCQECASQLSKKQTLMQHLGNDQLYHTAPDGLAGHIRSQLAQEAKVIPGKPRHPRRRWDLWTTAVASAACAALITLGVVRIAPQQVDPLMQTLVDSHVQSLMVDHLTDVSSSDQHTVKPWFNSKLDFSPRVVDFTSNGFPLVGGRLDYINGRPVSALVYRHRQHLINLYTWPAAEAKPKGPFSAQRQGYNLISWNKAGMHYWLVSDLNARELEGFAALIRK